MKEEAPRKNIEETSQRGQRVRQDGDVGQQTDDSKRAGVRRISVTVQHPGVGMTTAAVWGGLGWCGAVWSGGLVRGEGGSRVVGVGSEDGVKDLTGIN